MRGWWKWLLLIIVLGGAGAGVWAWVSQAGFAFQSAIKFRTAKVSTGRVEMVVNSSGTVKPVRSVSVGAFVSGPIAEIFVDFNSVVKEGQVLAKIDPRLLQAAYDRDKATLKSQEAERDRIKALLQQALNNEGRARKLREINADYLSDTEMDQYKFNRMSIDAQLELAQASIIQAIANLENSKTNLGYTEITSPVNGIIIEQKVEKGNTVAASFQTPELFIIGVDMDKHMFVNASVDEADIGLIRTAQAADRGVTFTVDAYQGEVFEGKIHQIRRNSTTTQNVVTYPVIIEAPNPDLKLFPGMTANISFQVEAHEDVLRVPIAALRYFPQPFQVRPEDRHHLEGRSSGQGQDKESPPQLSATEKAAAAKKRNQRLVWVKDGQLLRAVPVTLGLSDSQFAEVMEGELTDGQEVVTGLESPFGQAGR